MRGGAVGNHGDPRVEALLADGARKGAAPADRHGWLPRRESGGWSLSFVGFGGSGSWRGGVEATVGGCGRAGARFLRQVFQQIFAVLEGNSSFVGGLDFPHHHHPVGVVPAGPVLAPTSGRLVGATGALTARVTLTAFTGAAFA